MAKPNKRYNAPSDETKNEAMKIAKANQRPGQTKEQTKLIAQGIQKGIEQYKKQQKSKSRELDKKLKSAAQSKAHYIELKDKVDTQEKTEIEKSSAVKDSSIKSNKHWLPWILLALSWGLFLFDSLST